MKKVAETESCGAGVEELESEGGREQGTNESVLEELGVEREL